MRIDKPGAAELTRCFAFLDGRARLAGPPVFTRYVDLGTRMVRLINHSPAFTPHVERQLGCSLRDEAEHYDATLVVWQEKSVAEAALSLLQCRDAAAYRKLRVERLVRPATEIPAISFFDDEVLRHGPFIEADPKDGLISAWNALNNTHYYAVENLEPEEFIKRGHIFVQAFFRILNVPGSSLAHGAVVGLRNTGVLFCAVGYRGKSTLAVHCLLNGFDYVSDDYLVLGKKEDGVLRSWPIYSVIALAPQAYQAMYAGFRGKFLSNNARKDKYMFTIAEYHDSFRLGYPVKLCMFPDITARAEPGIVPGSKEQAFEELAFSSLNNTGNVKDALTIGKLYSFVHDLPFYRFNLSPDIERNTRRLREFLEHYN
jgi:hypothetical protein